jgi:hypothetical protein
MSSANRTRIIDPERAAESNSTLFLSVVCVAWSLALVTALVRFYTRAVLVRSFGKDDVFMAFSVVRFPLSPTGCDDKLTGIDDFPAVLNRGCCVVDHRV